MAVRTERARHQAIPRNQRFVLLMAVLQLLNATGADKEVLLELDRMVLGRHPDCDIVLDAARVSRQHAQIIARGGQLLRRRSAQPQRHVRQRPADPGPATAGRRRPAEDLRPVVHLLRQPAQRPAWPLWSDDEGSSLALMVDDGGPVTPRRRSCRSSTSARASAGVRLTVNPEVKLRAMIEIAQNLGKAVSLDEVLPKLLDSLFKIFLQADRGFVDSAQRCPTACWCPRRSSIAGADMEDQVRISRTIVNQVMTTPGSDPFGRRRQRLAVRHQPEHRRFAHSLGDVRAAGRQRRQLAGRDPDRHERSAAALSAGRSRRAGQHRLAGGDRGRQRRNCTTTRCEQHAMERDLELAHKVQRGLLPAAPPRVDGLSLLRFLRAGQPGRRRLLRLHRAARRPAGRRAGRRLGQRRLGRAADGQALGRSPLLPGQRADAGRGASTGSTPASAAAAGRTAS